MNIDRHDYHAAALSNRWRELLLREGTDALHDRAAALSLDELHHLEEKYEVLVRELSLCPPDGDLLPLDGVTDRRLRHALLILAAYRVRCAAGWLDLAARYGADPSNGVEPENLFAQFADAAEEFLRQRPTYWPFDDGRDPLGEDL
ncbi:MAG: hypothetical protein CL949_14920 [Erythrobacter sp.]|nr:hypothetical protein [Erythrobacter sp.]|tara:strand:- start:699 stop:1136 length:438 start_codon:yes stop_codon:yes gene_type:complete